MNCSREFRKSCFFVDDGYTWILTWIILLQVRERRAGALPWALEQGWKRFTMDRYDYLIILSFKHFVIWLSNYLRFAVERHALLLRDLLRLWSLKMLCKRVQKSDDQKSSNEERVRGKTIKGLQEQRVKVDKSCFFIKKVISEWLDFYLELWEDSSQRKQIAKLMLL